MVTWCILAKKQESADSSEPPQGEAIIPTLPDVKMCAAKAIGRSARNGMNYTSCLKVHLNV